MRAQLGRRRAQQLAAMLPGLTATGSAVAHVGADAPDGLTAMLLHLMTEGDHLAVLLVAAVVWLLARRVRSHRSPRERS